MKVLVSRWQMAMSEFALAYSVYVPIEEAPAFLCERPPRGTHCYVTKISREVGSKRRLFFEFDRATMPESLHDREPGWDKYEAWKAHETRAKDQALDLLKRAFPETVGLTEFPTLWVTGLSLRDGEKAEQDVWLKV